MIKSGLVRCVQRINYVKSYYIRDGQVQQTEEKILLCKFAEINKEKVELYLKKNHPYQTPECIYIKPDQVNQAYLQRIHQSTNHD